MLSSEIPRKLILLMIADAVIDKTQVLLTSGDYYFEFQALRRLKNYEFY